MSDARILTGDALTMLRTLPDESAQTCVCSPPYWGLRDYGTATWDGRDTACDHVERTAESVSAANTLGPDGYLPPTNAAFQGRSKQFRDLCGKCGARRIDQQLGLERTPDEYVTRLVEIFREVRRVLANDGTLWLNLGDSYARSWGAQGRQGANGEMASRSIVSARQIQVAAKKAHGTGSVVHLDGLKPKDLVGIPWRVAFALQADGWWLRADIVWSKTNCMPESVTDRPTKSHEYVFLLAKSATYFYDAAAIRERYQYGRDHHRNVDNPPESFVPGAPKHTGLRRSGNKARKYGGGDGQRPDDHRGASVPWTETPGGGRNARSVWTIGTMPYPEAHFATFPEELARRCILAGSREGDLVLDPFAGAGTTLLVALKAARRAIGIELNPEYVAMAERRLDPLVRQARAL